MASLFQRKPSESQYETPKEPDIPKEMETGWDLYNARTRNLDREMVKEWNENLNNLLIFSALYSGILAAFVIESMKRLEEDPQEVARDVLIFMANMAAPNTSFSPYVPTPFSAERYAIAMNYLFFLSLSLGLVVALTAIIILQWIGKYDARLSTLPNAEDRATTRHYRYEGVELWRLHGIIATLPILLFFSLSLFFIATIIWLWHIDTNLAWMVICIFLSAILFYFGTTLLAIIYPSAPFDTPLSGFLGDMFSLPTEKSERSSIKADTTLKLRTLLDQLDSIEVRKDSIPTIVKTLRSILHLPLDMPEGRQRLSELWENKGQKGVFRLLHDYCPKYKEFDEEQRCVADIAAELALFCPPDVSNEHGVSKEKKGKADEARGPTTHWLDPAAVVIAAKPERGKSLKELPEIAFHKLYILSSFPPACPEILNTLSSRSKVPTASFPDEDRIPEDDMGNFLLLVASSIRGVFFMDRPEFRPITTFEFMNTIHEPLTKQVETGELKKDAISNAISKALQAIFTRACAKLARETTLDGAEKELRGILDLFNHGIQARFTYVMVPVLLAAIKATAAKIPEADEKKFSKSASKALSTALETCYPKVTASIPLLQLALLIDHFLEDHKVGDEELKILTRAICFHPTYATTIRSKPPPTPGDRSAAMAIRNNAVKIMVLGISGNLLDVSDEHLGDQWWSNPLFAKGVSLWIFGVLKRAAESIQTSWLVYQAPFRLARHAEEWLRTLADFSGLPVQLVGVAMSFSYTTDLNRYFDFIIKTFGRALPRLHQAIVDVEKRSRSGEEPPKSRIMGFKKMCQRLIAKIEAPEDETTLINQLLADHV